MLFFLNFVYDNLCILCTTQPLLACNMSNKIIEMARGRQCKKLDTHFIELIDWADELLYSRRGRDENEVSVTNYSGFWKKYFLL